MPTNGTPNYYGTATASTRHDINQASSRMLPYYCQYAPATPADPHRQGPHPTPTCPNWETPTGCPRMPTHAGTSGCSRPPARTARPQQRRRSRSTRTCTYRRLPQRACIDHQVPVATDMSPSWPAPTATHLTFLGEVAHLYVFGVMWTSVPRSMSGIVPPIDVSIIAV